MLKDALRDQLLSKGEDRSVLVISTYLGLTWHEAMEGYSSPHRILHDMAVSIFLGVYRERCMGAYLEVLSGKNILSLYGHKDKGETSFHNGTFESRNLINHHTGLLLVRDLSFGGSQHWEDVYNGEARFLETATLLVTNMETQKGPYKDYSPFKGGLYGFPC